MKKTLLSTAVATALILSSHTYAAGGTKTHSDEVIPVDETQYNECTGENVHYTYLMQISSETDTKKDKTSTKLQIKYHNFHGVGETSGLEYTGKVNQNSKTTVDIEGSETVTVIEVELKAPGPDNNLKFKSYVHTIIDENGETKTDFKNSGTECH